MAALGLVGKLGVGQHLAAQDGKVDLALGNGLGSHSSGELMPPTAPTGSLVYFLMMAALSMFRPWGWNMELSVPDLTDAS